MIEPETERMPFLRHLPEQWAGVLHRFSVDPGSRHQGKSMSDVLLVGWMGGTCFAHIEGRGHAGIGDRECAALRVTHHGPSGRSIGHAWQLHEEEREVSFAPMRAPVLNHS